jgi:nucleoid-associated protein YgaU
VQSSVDAVEGARPESLGEVARRYRRQKSARDAEEALRTLLRSPYHMDLPKPSLGALSPLRVPPISAPAPVVKTGRPGASIAPLRRDPFARPPLSPSQRRLAPGPALGAAAPLSSSRGLPAAPPRSLPFASPRVLPGSSLSRPAMVTIQAGDSLWRLAHRHLGSGARWPEWLTSNPGLADPHRIMPGTILIVPRGPASARAISSSPSSISLRKGDSLWKIASTHFGRGADWPCLARANPGLRDVNRVYPGQTLIIPASCPPVPLRVPMR